MMLPMLDYDKEASDKVPYRDDVVERIVSPRLHRQAGGGMSRGFIPAFLVPIEAMRRHARVQ